MDGKDAGAMVKIGGEVLRVYAEEGPEYVARMANYINYIINEFNSKKGHGVRQNLLLAYAALELCDALFRERESRITETERNYETMFQMEVMSHRKTLEQLEDAQSRLAETEKQLAQVRKDLDDFMGEFGTVKESSVKESPAEAASPEKAEKNEEIKQNEA